MTMGHVCFAITAFSLLIISVTMLARANDLRWRPKLRSQLRLIGFVLSGTAPIGMIGAMWTLQNWPSPYFTAFSVGLVLVFTTTPYLPPWWKWLWGGPDA